MPERDWDQPNRWLSVIQLSGKIRPMQIMEALAVENIDSRPVWKPMHMQPVFANFDFIGSGVSQRLFENGLCLPSDTKMSDEDLERICSVIKSVV